MASSRATFHWADPLQLDAQLTPDERAVRDAAQAYCQERLLPRVQEAFRHEKTDAAIFREMGAIGLLGPHDSRHLRRPWTQLRGLRADRARGRACGLGATAR